LFGRADVDKDDEVSLTEFKKLLEKPETRAVMRVQYGLDVEQKSAESLFAMFDRDGDEVLSVEEFVFAVQRYRGQASSVELAQVLMQQMRMGRDLDHIHRLLKQLVPQPSLDLSHGKRPARIAICRPSDKIVDSVASSSATLHSSQPCATRFGRSSSYVLPQSDTLELD